MKDWQEKLNAFLEFNEYKILQNAGNISKKQADDYARNEYEKFESKRRAYIESLAEEEYIKDLEETAKMILSKNKGGDNHDNKLLCISCLSWLQNIVSVSSIYSVVKNGGAK